MSNATLPTISITSVALKVITTEAQRSMDGLETGGILLGTDTPEGIFIRHAGDPGPNARRSPVTFLRDLRHAQQLAETAWREDRSQWVGEWHTHPMADLTPSSLDVDSYRRHLRDRDLRLDHFVAIIVAVPPGGRIGAATWLIDRNWVRLVRLKTEGTSAGAHA